MATERVITLTNAQMLFYEKNVIHDVIHDYGFFAAETRWLKNIDNLKHFISGNDFTINLGIKRIGEKLQNFQ